MLDSPIEHRPDDSPPSDERNKSLPRNSPTPSDKSGASPRSDDEKHIPQLPVGGAKTSPDGKADGGGGGGNSLAALQKLCNDQKKTPKQATKDPSSQPMSDPGAMLAFSWACNQAVSHDSAIKCPFCDTPFISKGAYRHHLSKMHFTKENIGSITPNIPEGPGRSPSPNTKDAEESLQAKYQKYTQLAKQLSCYDNV